MLLKRCQRCIAGVAWAKSICANPIDMRPSLQPGEDRNITEPRVIDVAKSMAPLPQTVVSGMRTMSK